MKKRKKAHGKGSDRKMNEDRVKSEPEKAEADTEETVAEKAKDDNNTDERIPTENTAENAAEQSGKEQTAAEKRQCEKLQEQMDALNDKYLRVVAEYDNYRRRSVKEKSAAYTDAYADAASAFLPLLDNMDRALEYANDDSKLSEGLRLLQKQLVDILAKIEVVAFESDGQPFNPELHNAIAHEESDEYPESTIIQTFQKGYKYKDKVIRHAIVKVAN